MDTLPFRRTVGPIGEVGEILASASTEEVVSHTPVEELKERALYEQHREQIELNRE
jgi:hypothetical protein